MTPIQPIPHLLRRLWSHISPRRRGQFQLLLVLMLLASFAEMLSIGAVLPFLGVLSAPERIFGHPVAQPIVQIFGISEPAQLLLPLTILFGGAALMAGALRLLLLWASTRLSHATGADLSISIYRRTLYQPYSVHIARNSSEIINGIAHKTKGVIGIINMVLTLIGSTVMLITILTALFSIEPLVTIIAVGGFGLIYIMIIMITRRHQRQNSRRISQESTNVVKALQEGLGGIRDVLLDGSQSSYCQIYRDADLPLRQATASSAFIANSPRYGMESLGMLLIAGLAYGLAQQPGGVGTAIPILGTLALGAQRLLPIMQQAYAAWSGIQAGQVSLHDALLLLDQPLPDYANQKNPEPLPFKDKIKLNQLAFRYSQETNWVFKNINLCIFKGERVGFIGTTGTGKSTLLDVVMGLLEPSEGELQVDGQIITPKNNRAWQAHIAHVPQVIFLSDTSIEENIAFGQPAEIIDRDRVKECARQAQLAETIEAWPGGYQTLVGERGVRLSGGQRQRIGIARALYKKADVIVFDEATSALDTETEDAVMQAIEGLSDELTILIIAHRITTLKNCTRIIELGDGAIRRIGRYEDIS